MLNIHTQTVNYMFEGNQRNTCVEKKMYVQRLYCSIVQKKKKLVNLVPLFVFIFYLFFSYLIVFIYLYVFMFWLQNMWDLT